MIPAFRRPDPAEAEHFRAFGFVVLRSALAPESLDALSAEADRAVPEATGEAYLVSTATGGIEGHYIPATSAATPISVGMAVGLAPLAEALLGVPVVLATAAHNVLFDMAAWHTDTGHDIASIKAVAYLESLSATTGALRVLPGSHVIPYRHLAAYLQGGSFRHPDRWRQAVASVPAHVIDTRPGDLIFFDEHLFHASAYGRNRRQWAAEYVKDPATSEEEAAVGRYLASQFVADRLDYDPNRYPHYGKAFRRAAPRRWVEQLERLGAFEAAAAEEHRGWARSDNDDASERAGGEA